MGFSTTNRPFLDSQKFVETRISDIDIQRKHCWCQDTTSELPPERWDMDAYYDADVDAPGGCAHRTSNVWHEICMKSL